MKKTSNYRNLNYFDKLENIDFYKFKKLNEKLRINDIHRTKRFTFYDCSGTLSNGKEVIIELKSRNYDLVNINNQYSCIKSIEYLDNNQTTFYNSLVIDLSKFSKLYSKLSNENEILYISFFKNNYISIFNFKDLQEAKISILNYYNIGKEKKQTNTLKVLLPISQSYIYKIDNNQYTLVQSPLNKNNNSNINIKYSNEKYK